MCVCVVTAQRTRHSTVCNKYTYYAYVTLCRRLSSLMSVTRILCMCVCVCVCVCVCLLVCVCVCVCAINMHARYMLPYVDV
jgi:hypothetical protein